MENVSCSNCGTENPESARFCMACGLSLVPSCGVCGEPLPPGAQFCPSCGARILPGKPPTGMATEVGGAGAGAGAGAPPGQVPVGQIAKTGVIQAGEERRVVTILFGDLSGFTALAEDRDAEEIKAALDATFRALGGVIDEHGGAVDKFIGDNIMATFGAPTAHEDDPERAVRAALAMRDLLDERNAELESAHGFKFEMRIGINSGEVMAGRLGADRADAYTVMGDAVNVASRLEQAASPGQILVGSETRNLCSQGISFSKGRRISMKGKAAAIEAFEAIEATAAPAPGGRERERERGGESPFVGRAEELAAISSLAHAARDLKKSHFVTVLGEPGVGKTRLLEEAADQLRPDGFVFIWGRVAPYGSAPALMPAVDMIRTVCEVADDDDVDAAREKITARIARLLEASPAGGSEGLSRRLLDVIGLSEEGGGHAGVREASGPIDRFFEALAAESPLVLVFDDLHWADDELLQLVEGMPDRLRDAPVVVMSVARPRLIDYRADWGGGKRFAYTMQLEALSDAEAEAFVKSTLGGDEVAREAIELVVARAGGNPLFLAELTSFLVGEEIIVDGRDGWEIADASRLAALPNNLRSVVAARLDSLPVDDKELLQLASVVGDTFWAGALASITGIDEEEMTEPLQRLVDADLLVVSGRPALSGEREYRFRHGLTREAAYRTLPRARRARLHTLAGSWLESRATVEAIEGEDDPEGIDFPMLVSPAGGLLEEIAYHYEQSARLTEGDEETQARDRAFHFLAGAARQAVDRNLFLQADRLYVRAHEMGGPSTESVEGQGAALFGLGRIEEAERLFDDGLDRSIAGGDRAAQARILTRMAELRHRQSQNEDAVDLADSALEIWRELGDVAGETDTLLVRGRIYVRTGRSSEAFADFAVARTNASGLEDRRQEAWALQNMAWCRFNSGLFGGARELVEESLLRFSSMSEVDGIGSAVVLLGWIDTFDGRLIEPRETAEGLRKLAHETGEYWGEGLCATLECLTSVGLGEALRGRREGLEALQILSDVEDRWAQAVAGLYMGRAEEALARPREALAAYRDALRHARAAGDPVIEGSILYYWAWLLLDEGDIESAAARAAEALAVTGDLPASQGPWSGEALRLSAAIAHATDFDQVAEDLLVRASGDSGDEAHAHSVARRRALADLAILRLDAGEAADALAACERALDLYSEDHESTVMVGVAHGLALEALGKSTEAAETLEATWELARGAEDAVCAIRAAEALASLRDAIDDPEGATAIRDEVAAFVEDLSNAEVD